MKKERGITLIALVVTIVVLIILATISINAIFGENGIIKRAEKAKEEYEEARILEEIQMKLIGTRMDEILSGEINNELIEKLGIKGIEKIEVENEEETYYYIIEKEGSYYRTIMKNNTVLSMEKIERLKETAVAFLKYLGKQDVIMISKTQFEYQNIGYNYYENKSEDNVVIYVEEIIPIKMIVNSGEDGVVVLPIDAGKVDWGDGSTNYDGIHLAKKEVKLATVKDIQLAIAVPGISHTYSETNKEFTVTITTTVPYISTKLYNDVTKEKIIEVLQWGTTGLRKICLADCRNLRKIASPNNRSFVNVTSFSGAFANCISLTEIPSDLFDNCPKAGNISEAFYNCTNLTGLAPELWKEGTNNESNNYQGSPDGMDCFYNCTGLSNYADIPEYWK